MENVCFIDQYLSASLWDGNSRKSWFRCVFPNLLLLGYDSFNICSGSLDMQRLFTWILQDNTPLFIEQIIYLFNDYSTQFKNTTVRMDLDLQTLVINKCKIFKLTSEETYNPHLINTLEYYITNITQSWATCKYWMVLS